MYLYLICTLLYATLSKSEELLVKASGIGYINEGDIAMIFYVTLENTCDKEFDVSVSMVQCCDTIRPDEIDCSYMSLIGGNMGILYGKYTKNVTLIYPNLYLKNRKGQCTVNIQYRNEGVSRQMMTVIEFNTVVKNEDECECPSTDMDPKLNCKPVDCVVKYSGMKSYFDPKRGQCVCATQCPSSPEDCTPEIGYSIATNNCTSLNNTVTKEDLQVLESNRTVPEECLNNILNNMVCHHGTTDSTGKCECDAGWTTTTDEEMYSPTLMLYHMCNIEVGAWNCLNMGKIRTTTILISVFAITIASKILIVMCILNWCYQRYKLKKDLVCNRELDPDNEEIVLCEQLEEFEACLCENPPQNKSHFLEAQTMNVTYYPCAPSTLSSIRASSVSRKCPCPNSDESIELSKTTTSSSAVPPETESEVATDVSELADEELDAEEDSDMDEEIYGEGGKSDDDVYEELGEQYDEQSDYSGNVSRASKRASSSSKSVSAGRKSRDSTNTRE